jgi:hypothetical protein
MIYRSSREKGLAINLRSVQGEGAGLNRVRINGEGIE